MNREDILEYITEDLVNKATFYSHTQIPSQISNAIYTFGSSEITDILAFIDMSQDLDGTHGMIITPAHIYFQFAKSGSFAYDDIVYLSLEKHRHSSQVIATIKTNEKSYVFKNNYLNQEALIMFLSNITDKHVDMIMSDFEKIEYYTNIVIKDIEEDVYEDVELTSSQKHTLKDLKENLEVISRMEDGDYQEELKSICPQALNFFFELELDSDEIDILIEIEKELSKQESEEDQQFNQARQYYDEMMDQYAKGNTQMYDQFKGTMDSLGINEEEMRNKSPEELNQYIDELCDRFGISRSMVDKLTKKFTKK